MNNTMDDNEKNQVNQSKHKFKIIDRRRIKTEEDDEQKLEAAPTSQPDQASQSVDEKKSEKKSEKSPAQDQAEQPKKEPSEKSEDPIGIRNLSLSFIQTLSTVGWVHLGYVPHPKTQLVAKDLDQARKVINLLEAIFLQTKTELPAEVNNEIISILQELKTAYVNSM